MKKVWLISILLVGIVNAQSFKSGANTYQISTTNIVITGSNGVQEWVVDSTEEVILNGKRAINCYLHKGNDKRKLVATEDGVQWDKMTTIQGIWEPSFLNASSMMCYELQEWQDNFPPFEYHDTIFYRHPHRVIK